MEEEEIKAFLKQFGSIESVKVSRSNRAPYRSRGYCFVKFRDSSVAAIVASTLSGYIIMQEKRLVSHVVPSESVHPNLFKNRKTFFLRKQAAVLGEVRRQQQRYADQHNHKVKEAFCSSKKVHDWSDKLCKKEKKKRQKLALLGIEYEFPGYTHSVIVSTTAELAVDEGGKETEAEVAHQVNMDVNGLKSIDEETELVATPTVKKGRSPIQTRSAKKRSSDYSDDTTKNKKTNTAVDSGIILSSKTSLVHESLTTPSKLKTRSTKPPVATPSRTCSEIVLTSTEKSAVVAATPSTKTKSTNALRSPIGTRSATKRLNNDTAAEETSSKATSTGNTKDNLFSKEEMVQNDKTDSEVSLKIKKKKSTDVVKERLVQNNSKGPSIEEDGFKTAVTEEDAKSSKNQKDNEGRGKRRSKAVCNETDDSVATNDTVEQNLSKKQTKVMVKTQSKAMQKRSEPTDQKALLNARTSAVKKKTAKSSI
jgi:RNA recognition motif-containing protein